MEGRGARKKRGRSTGLREGRGPGQGAWGTASKGTRARPVEFSHGWGTTGLSSGRGAITVATGRRRATEVARRPSSAGRSGPSCGQEAPPLPRPHKGWRRGRPHLEGVALHQRDVLLVYQRVLGLQINHISHVTCGTGKVPVTRRHGPAPSGAGDRQARAGAVCHRQQVAVPGLAVPPTPETAPEERASGCICHLHEATHPTCHQAAQPRLCAASGANKPPRARLRGAEEGGGTEADYPEGFD